MTPVPEDSGNHCRLRSSPLSPGAFGPCVRSIPPALRCAPRLCQPIFHGWHRYENHSRDNIPGYRVSYCLLVPLHSLRYCPVHKAVHDLPTGLCVGLHCFIFLRFILTCATANFSMYFCCAFFNASVSSPIFYCDKAQYAHHKTIGITICLNTMCSVDLHDPNTRCESESAKRHPSFRHFDHIPCAHFTGLPMS